MRVLHLPANIASQTSVTVRALRDIGIEARGLFVGNHSAKSCMGLEKHEIISRRRYPIRGSLRILSWWAAVLRAISWSDVVHVCYNASALPYDMDLKYAARLRKARLVEFWGSDIRIPEIASADNRYAARFYAARAKQVGAHGYTPRETQERFARHGYQCLVPKLELRSYIQKDLFPSPYYTRERVLLRDYEPRYPHPEKTQPLIVHTPTEKHIKGTNAVLRAIATLRRSHDFDFKLVHGMDRSAAMAILRECDVFLDQFVIGDHGLAALEAMAYGKLTVCYIKPSLVPEYPPDLPIVNANQDNLGEVLKELLESGWRRNEIGRQSRAYVEKYHDAHRLARQLAGIYEELLEKSPSSRSRAGR